MQGKIGRTKRRLMDSVNAYQAEREGTVRGGSVAYVRATWRRNNRTPTSHKSGTQFRRKQKPRREREREREGYFLLIPHRLLK